MKTIIDKLTSNTDYSSLFLSMSSSLIGVSVATSSWIMFAISFIVCVFANMIMRESVFAATNKAYDNGANDLSNVLKKWRDQSTYYSQIEEMRNIAKRVIEGKATNEDNITLAKFVKEH